MRAAIILHRTGKAYFKSKDTLSEAQWKELFDKLARRTLAKNGWELIDVEVSSE